MPRRQEWRHTTPLGRIQRPRGGGRYVTRSQLTARQYQSAGKYELYTSSK